MTNHLQRERIVWLSWSILHAQLWTLKHFPTACRQSLCMVNNCSRRQWSAVECWPPLQTTDRCRLCVENTWRRLHVDVAKCFQHRPCDHTWRPALCTIRWSTGREAASCGLLSARQWMHLPAWHYSSTGYYLLACICPSQRHRPVINQSINHVYLSTQTQYNKINSKKQNCVNWTLRLK